MNKIQPTGFLLLIGMILLVFLPCGCSHQHYKEQADEDVESILNEKWEPEFGSKANYRISDVEPSPDDVKIEAAKDVSGRISLAEALALATAHNREYQSQKESLYSSALALTLDRHDFETQFFGMLDGGYSRNSSDESVNMGGSLGISQLLAEGAQISTSIAMDWLRYLTGDPRTSLGSVLSATIRQPLLRGAGRRIVQENLTQAERDVLYSIRNFNRYRKEFVVRIVNSYYSVLQTLDSVDNARENYESLTYFHERQRMMADAGRVEPLRASEAEQNKLQAGDNYIAAQEDYKQQLDRYKITLGLPTEADLELDPNELKFLEAIAITRPDFDTDELIRIALKKRLDLANERDQVADAERHLIVARDNLRMDLDLVASGNVDSTGDSQFARFQFHEGSYAVGFDLDLNLDRLSERNSYRRALISLTQQQRNYQQQTDEVKFDVRQAYRDLDESAARYEIRRLGLELALKRVEGERLKLEAGRAVTRDLLDAQEDLLDAQNDRTIALVGFTIAKLNFYRDLGILQVRPDGMWEYETP